MSAREEEWVDTTSFDSSYEEQCQIYSGRYRHRPLRLHVGDGPPRRQHDDDGWKPGPAPDRIGESIHKDETK